MIWPPYAPPCATTPTCSSMVATSPRGDAYCAFIDQLAAATGARVAASTNLTGAADQGGDWVLEARTAAMRSAALAFPAYRMVLPTVAGTVTIPFSHPDGSFFTSMMVDGQINTGTTDIALAVVYQFYFAASGNTLTGTATNIDLAGGTGSMLLYHSGIGYDPVASFIIKSQSNRMFGLFSFQDSGCTRAGLQLHGLRLPQQCLRRQPRVQRRRQLQSRAHHATRQFRQHR
ncbi:DUF4347 domain-containing protein [Massilia sp. B-10]|nr:DUF4347 domain-containing protein [Massilia sp. B-10]